MGKAQTLQAMSNRSRKQQGVESAAIKSSGSLDSLLADGSRSAHGASPRGRDSPFGKLPNIQGVNKLTRTEVRKDLDEIDQLSGAALAELDDLRILPSFYPVKPRVELKIPEHSRSAQRAVQLTVIENKDDTPMGDLLEFLRLVEVVRPDILDAERERERLECKYLAIRDNFVAETIRQKSNNRDRYNFMRALQVMLCRGICQYSVSSHHTSMLSDLLTLLEEKSAATRKLKDAKSSLDKVKGGMQSQPTALFRPVIADNCPAVAVKKSDGTSVLLHTEMKLDTPFGAGVLQGIRVAGIKAVEIKLPFGMLYTSPAEAVQWFSFVNDESCTAITDDNAVPKYDNNKHLVHRWQQDRQGLFLPLDVQHNIFANKDVLSRVDAANAIMTEQYLSDTIDAGTLVDSSQLAGDIPDSCSESMDIDEEGKEEAENGTTEKPTVKSSANGLIDSMARDAISECLPYLFVPPEALPRISERISTGRSQHMLYRHAFMPAINIKTIDSMKSRLNNLQSQIDSLQKEKLNHMNSVSLCGKQGAKLTQEVALTRLSMFTRRVRRRTVLQNGEITTDEVTSNIPNTINIKNNGMSPTLKPNDTRKTTRRSGIATPQKPAVGKEPEEESASGSPGTVSSMGTSGRSRSLRGSHPPDKEKKESTGRGNKRKSSGSGFDDTEPVGSSQPGATIEDPVKDSANTAATGAPRSKRSRKL